jgi:hypothetical protein
LPAPRSQVDGCAAATNCVYAANAVKTDGVTAGDRDNFVIANNGCGAIRIIDGDSGAGRIDGITSASHITLAQAPA